LFDDVKSLIEEIKIKKQDLHRKAYRMAILEKRLKSHSYRNEHEYQADLRSYNSAVKPFNNQVHDINDLAAAINILIAKYKGDEG
jgi:hypothetical protein